MSESNEQSVEVDNNFKMEDMSQQELLEYNDWCQKMLAAHKQELLKG